jgi:hypothetical protein
MRRLSRRRSKLGFRDGFLYAAVDGTFARVCAWPRLAVQTRDPAGIWRDREVAFRDRLFEAIGYLRPPAPTDCVFARDRWWTLDDQQGCFAWSLDPRERRRAWGQFGWERLDATIPGELSRRLLELPVDWFSALELAQNAPAALDLLAHDPLIFTALARHWEFPALGRVDWAAVRQQVRRKRREILAWLGYAPSESIANALRRHEVVEIHTNRVGAYVRQFLDVMQHPQYAPELLRCEKTASDLMFVLDCPDTQLWLDGAMLREVLRAHRGGGFDAMSELNEISAMVSCGLVKPSPAFFREFWRKGRTSLEWVKDTVADLPFPRWPQPVVQGIEALTSVHQLVAEGQEMHHCVGSMGYAAAALQGYLAVFRVTSPIRATLALRHLDGRWFFEGLTGASNGAVSPEHRAEILRAFPAGVGRGSEGGLDD